MFCYKKTKTKYFVTDSFKTSVMYWVRLVMNVGDIVLALTDIIGKLLKRRSWSVQELASDKLNATLYNSKHKCLYVYVSKEKKQIPLNQTCCI